MGKVRVTKSALWRTIRKHCLECVGESSNEALLCTCPDCLMYPYRFGRPLGITDPAYVEGTCEDGNYKSAIYIIKGRKMKWNGAVARFKAAE